MSPFICVCKRTDVFDDMSEEWERYHEDNETGRAEIAKILVKHYEENGFDLKIKDSLGRNGLHHACGSSTEIVRLLLEHGFGDEINTKDEHGRTPLHHACSVENEGQGGYCFYPETVELLLSKMEELGLDPNIKDNKGQTAIQTVRDEDMYLEDEDKKKICDVFAKYGVTEN